MGKTKKKSKKIPENFEVVRVYKDFEGKPLAFTTYCIHKDDIPPFYVAVYVLSDDDADDDDDEDVETPSEFSTSNPSTNRPKPPEAFRDPRTPMILYGKSIQYCIEMIRRGIIDEKGFYCLGKAEFPYYEDFVKTQEELAAKAKAESEKSTDKPPEKRKPFTVETLSNRPQSSIPMTKIICGDALEVKESKIVPKRENPRKRNSVVDIPTLYISDDSSDEAQIHYPPDYRNPVTGENMNPTKLSLMEMGDLAFATPPRQDDSELSDAPLIASSSKDSEATNNANGSESDSSDPRDSLDPSHPDYHDDLAYENAAENAQNLGDVIFSHQREKMRKQRQRDMKTLLKYGPIEGVPQPKNPDTMTPSEFAVSVLKEEELLRQIPIFPKENEEVLAELDRAFARKNNLTFSKPKGTIYKAEELPDPIVERIFTFGRIHFFSYGPKNGKKEYKHLGLVADDVMERLKKEKPHFFTRDWNEAHEFAMAVPNLKFNIADNIPAKYLHEFFEKTPEAAELIKLEIERRHSIGVDLAYEFPLPKTFKAYKGFVWGGTAETPPEIEQILEQERQDRETVKKKLEEMASDADDEADDLKVSSKAGFDGDVEAGSRVKRLKRKLSDGSQKGGNKHIKQSRLSVEKDEKIKDDAADVVKPLPVKLELPFSSLDINEPASLVISSDTEDDKSVASVRSKASIRKSKEKSIEKELNSEPKQAAVDDAEECSKDEDYDYFVSSMSESELSSNDVAVEAADVETMDVEAVDVETIAVESIVVESIAVEAVAVEAVIDVDFDVPNPVETDASPRRSLSPRNCPTPEIEYVAIEDIVLSPSIVSSASSIDTAIGAPESMTDVVTVESVVTARSVSPEHRYLILSDDTDCSDDEAAIIEREADCDSDAAMPLVVETSQRMPTPRISSSRESIASEIDENSVATAIEQAISEISVIEESYVDPNEITESHISEIALIPDSDESDVVPPLVTETVNSLDVEIVPESREASPEPSLDEPESLPQLLESVVNVSTSPVRDAVPDVVMNSPPQNDEPTVQPSAPLPRRSSTRVPSLEQMLRDFGPPVRRSSRTRVATARFIEDHYPGVKGTSTPHNRTVSRRNQSTACSARAPRATRAKPKAPAPKRAPCNRRTRATASRATVAVKRVKSKTPIRSSPPPSPIIAPRRTRRTRVQTPPPMPVPSPIIVLRRTRRTRIQTPPPIPAPPPASRRAPRTPASTRKPRVTTVKPKAPPKPKPAPKKPAAPRRNRQKRGTSNDVSYSCRVARRISPSTPLRRSTRKRKSVDRFGSNPTTTFDFDPEPAPKIRRRR